MRVTGLRRRSPPTKSSLATRRPTCNSLANDTSGALAALGLNTFFAGSADDLGVNQNLVADPGKFAASTSGVGIGTGNATQLANFMNQPLTSAGGTT